MWTKLPSASLEEMSARNLNRSSLRQLCSHAERGRDDVDGRVSLDFLSLPPEAFPVSTATFTSSCEAAHTGLSGASIQTSHPLLTASKDEILETCQLLRADWTACMHFTGRDTDFGTHAKLAPVRELGGRVVHHDG
ncbi:hypothetical protein SAMN05216227_10704 [Pseudorhodobacter antarcticus]|uniref:Uncharacterized protein n=1 Tax=Pseudorhodobacter antarcticus TaxID=1077947 RepID=A0A1H8N421_9RHOB|nr:hypothetical protein SAMN05216227_10704 [Pseudorhodobacter antarcticus]